MKTTITGNVAVVTTSITAEQFAQVAKRMPELLTVKEDKTEVFKAMTAETGAGSIGKYGAEFVEGVNGKLGVTIQLPAGITTDEAKAFVYDKVAAALPYIEKIEQAVSDNITAIIAAEQEFVGAITVS